MADALPPRDSGRAPARYRQSGSLSRRAGTLPLAVADRPARHRPDVFRRPRRLARDGPPVIKPDDEMSVLAQHGPWQRRRQSSPSRHRCASNPTSAAELVRNLRGANAASILAANGDHARIRPGEGWSVPPRPNSRHGTVRIVAGDACGSTGSVGIRPALPDHAVERSNMSSIGTTRSLRSANASAIDLRRCRRR